MKCGDMKHEDEERRVGEFEEENEEAPRSKKHVQAVISVAV